MKYDLDEREKIIIKYLLEHGPAQFGELLKHSNSSKPTFSKYLKTLKAKHYIEEDKSGRWTKYFIPEQHKSGLREAVKARLSPEEYVEELKDYINKRERHIRHIQFRLEDELAKLKEERFRRKFLESEEYKKMLMRKKESKKSAN